SGLLRARRVEHRQPNDELAAAAESLAARLDRAAVDLDESLDQSEADPEPALRSLTPGSHLGKHLEDRLQLVGRDADPVVLDRDDDLLVGSLCDDLNVPAVVRVLAGVGQEVAENLHEPNRIPPNPYRLRRGRYRELLARSVRKRPRRLGRLV